MSKNSEQKSVLVSQHFMYAHQILQKKQQFQHQLLLFLHATQKMSGFRETTF
jgi:hypothetical protein